MATINAAAVFEDVATRLSNGIPQTMASRDITSILIDKEAYREFEENNTVRSLFAEARPDPTFQITAAQRNQLIYVWVGITETRTELQNAELERINENISRSDPSEANPLAIRVHAAVIGAS